MTINCPQCGELCESDEEIPAGQLVECPFCYSRFYYGADAGNADNIPSNGNAYPMATEEPGKTEVKFCGRCGAKIPESASFCPGCGSSVLSGEDNAAEVKAGMDSKGVESAAEAKRTDSGKFQKLLGSIKLSIILSAIAAIIGCIDIRVCYGLGRTGHFLLASAELGVQIWLYKAVAHVKSWARKSLMVLYLASAAFSVAGLAESGFENPVVFMLDIAVVLIMSYCVWLCFQGEVAVLFRPNPDLDGTIAKANTIQCINFWIAIGLIIGVGSLWQYRRYGTDDWYSDCLAANVKGSSSAKEMLFDYANEEGSADDGIQATYADIQDNTDNMLFNVLDEPDYQIWGYPAGGARPRRSIQTMPSYRHNQHGSNNGPKPSTIAMGLRLLFAVVVALCGFISSIISLIIAKFRGK